MLIKKYRVATTFCFYVAVMLLSSIVAAQEEEETFWDKVYFNGYLSNIGQGTIADDLNSETQLYADYILHNRMNFTYYHNDNINFGLQFRNQFVAGESFDLIPGYAESYKSDQGFVDLKFNWWEGDNNLMSTQIDRLYVEFTMGNWETAIGRQRINWGRSLVWNPNDIFNTFSFYDIDYIERPGADTWRVRYYYGIASEVEVVAKLDSANNVTVAGLTKFNKWGYDIQFMGGYANSEDFVIGTGWEGSIGSVSFRGEGTYWHPQENFSDTTGALLASVSLDYAINSKLTTQVEFLYNDPDNLIDFSEGAFSIYSAPSTAKTLSFSVYNIFGNLAYQVNPILKLSFAGMYYTDYSGYFLMPNADVSVSESLTATLLVQYFDFELLGKRQDSGVVFARLKWNF